MKKILVPVDFSTCSDNASEYAFDLAKSIGAELRFLHVMYDPIVQADLPNYGYGAATGSTENVIYKIEIEARKSLKHLLERYEIKAEMEEVEVHVSAILRDGFPESEVMEECERYQPDLILLGTHGRGQMEQLLLGSVSARVIEQAKVPVLAIPNHIRFAGIERILYASDFAEKDGKNVCALAELFRTSNPTIACVNVVWDIQKELQAWQRGALRQELETLIRTDCEAENLQFDIIEGTKMELRLNSYIVEQEADILVMSNHRRNFFGKLFTPSKTRKMLGSTHIPLLAMHA